MISKFRVKNFRSIVDYTLDLSYAEGKAPAGYQDMSTYPFLEAGEKTRLVPCLALFGANASGKSNLLRAFQTLRQILTDAPLTDCYQPNRLHPGSEETSFEIDFFASGLSFCYRIDYTDAAIRHESLASEGRVLYSIEATQGDFTGIATENYPESKLQEVLRVECSEGGEKKRVGELASRSLFPKETFPPRHIRPMLSVLATNYGGLNYAVWAASHHLRATLWPSLFSSRSGDLLTWLDLLASLRSLPDKETVLVELGELLAQLDIDIERIYSTPILSHNLGEKSARGAGGQEKPQEMLMTRHSTLHGDPVAFDFQEESDGTRVLSVLLAQALIILEMGGVLVVDELDRSLHPLLQHEIIRLFKDKARNPKQAQLIFSSHSTDILEGKHLRLSEVGIVSKTPKHGTTCKRLAEFKGVRNVTNFRKQYLDGAFAGIPFPYL